MSKYNKHTHKEGMMKGKQAKERANRKQATEGTFPQVFYF